MSIKTLQLSKVMIDDELLDDCTSGTITIKADIIDTSSIDSKWKSYKPGKKYWYLDLNVLLDSESLVQKKIKDSFEGKQNYLMNVQCTLNQCDEWDNEIETSDPYPIYKGKCFVTDIITHLRLKSVHTLRIKMKGSDALSTKAL